MVKNIEETDAVSFGFMMPLGISSKNHRIFYDVPDLYAQNMEGTVYKFEDDNFNGSWNQLTKKCIDRWISEIRSHQDKNF
ncbi:MAG: hypothetical protein D8M58_15860 [Calditrichaeota bacterium]|nr:MAG: hypothetical protein DWQ03_07590 [Calditrichota bacterium]MBL1206880.1 hypothetical protein [Calditrichota bacterium]NOG46707.1 hypothetical protein [Calditrichota bacterium]